MDHQAQISPPIDMQRYNELLQTPQYHYVRESLELLATYITPQK